MPGRLSQMEISDRVNHLKDRQILMLSIYSGCDTKHKFKCLKNTCNHNWDTTFTSVTKLKTGCPKCSLNYVDSEILEKKLCNLRSRKIDLISEYTSSSKIHDFKCLDSECGHVWNARWSTIIRSQLGCPKCYLDGKLNIFKSKQIQPIYPYVGIHHKTDFNCLSEGCGYAWNTTWGSITNQNTGCPKCAGFVIDEDIITKRLSNLKSRDIQANTTYKKARSKAEFECLKTDCGHRWISNWMAVTSTKMSGCPKCSGRFIDDKTLDMRKREMRLRGVEPVKPYVNSQLITEFRCLDLSCSYVWKDSWSNMFHRKQNCPRCIGRHKTPEEKALMKLRYKIRTRLREMYISGKVVSKLYKDDDYMNNLLSYCKTQLSKIPKKPDDKSQDWHLDHIIPVSKFNPLDMEQVKLCWDYRNFQWLPAKVNLSKSAKLMPEYFTDWHYQVLDTLGLGV